MCYKNGFSNKKNSFELMNNSFYGKTMRKNINAELVDNAQKSKAWKNVFGG